MLKKLLVSLLSALLCISVVAETGESAIGYASIPLKYRVTSDSTAVVIYDYSYKKLKSVVIPSEIRVDGHVYSVTSVGEGTFRYCCELTSIEIPSSVTSIKAYAFSGCSGLTSIEIPSSVTSIEDHAFSYCKVLINVAPDNPIYSSVEGILYDKNKTELISASGWKENVEIPSSVTSIGDHAFEDCRGLTNIKIPSIVTSIGYGAFWGCDGLTSIKIPSSVTNIGGGAFYRCENLEIVIDNSKENISVGENAFYGCKSVKFLK